MLTFRSNWKGQIMKQNLVAQVAIVFFGLVAFNSAASAFEQAGRTVSAQSQISKTVAIPIEGSDDDETFFSGGSNPSVPSLKSAPASTAAVDVVAVCRAVLAEAPTNYNARFYEGCQTAVTQRAVRRANRD